MLPQFTGFVYYTPKRVVARVLQTKGEEGLFYMKGVGGFEDNITTGLSPGVFPNLCKNIHNDANNNPESYVFAISSI